MASISRDKSPFPVEFQPGNEAADEFGYVKLPNVNVLVEMADRLARESEVRDIQGYAGTASPINFNGLVRQYYLRSGGNVGDLQVNLTDKHDRSEQSHAIATRVRWPKRAPSWPMTSSG